jgi:hypothetical protein
VDIAVRIEPVAGDRTAPVVDYRWDADTTILCATVRADGPAASSSAGASGSPARAVAESGPGFEPGMSGSVEIEGRDGSWLVLDVAAGSVRSVEVAVWPDVRHRSSLRPPADAELARVVLPGRRAATAAAAATTGFGSPTTRDRATAADAVDSLEINTAVAAESDEAERTIHFLLGPSRPAKRVRVARDLVFDVDDRSRLAGLWLLNVPPCPSDT